MFARSENKNVFIHTLPGLHVRLSLLNSYPGRHSHSNDFKMFLQKCWHPPLLISHSFLSTTKKKYTKCNRVLFKDIIFKVKCDLQDFSKIEDRLELDFFLKYIYTLSNVFKNDALSRTTETEKKTQIKKWWKQYQVELQHKSLDYCFHRST